MNDNFGSISQDFLPPGFGDLPGKVQQRVGEDAPTMEAVHNPDDYDGMFDIFKKTDEEKALADAAKDERKEDRADRKAVKAADTDQNAFFANWFKKEDKSSSTGTSPTTASVPPASRVCKGVNGYNYRQHASGKIVILPGSMKGVGTTVQSVHQAAVAAEIKAVCGPYPTSGGEAEDGANSFLASLMGGASDTSRSASAGAGIGAGIGAAAAQLLPSLLSILGPQQDLTLEEETSEDTGGDGGGTPWGVIIGSVVVLGLVGGGIYLATRDDDDDYEE